MFDSEGRNAKCAGRSLRAVPATCQGTEAGDASPSTPIQSWIVYICQPPIKQFLRILLSLTQHGREPRDGGDRAGIGRPQRPAIHRMEEEIEGGMEEMQVRIGREFN
jgi:hypothetical protein